MKILDVAKLTEMFEGGYKNLSANKAMIDSLNVFPVPDGDTGTNMSMTMASAVKEIQNVVIDEPSDLFNAFARGALKGARGNSGVILSQIVKGMCKTLSDEKQLNTKAFAKAFICAREVAYGAVTKPKEGTILTVIRFIAENAMSIASKNSSFITFFEQIIAKGEEILQKTPEMLPVLKKAGVVDAGGRGLITVLEGYLKVLKGEEIAEQEGDMTATPAPILDAFGDDEHDLDNIKFAYCTEYFVINIKKHVTEEDVEKLRDKLMTIGDCVIAIGDTHLIKVHVHTNQPNRALYWALQLGELDKVKIENMLEQNRELQKQRQANKKPIAMMAICAGDGLSKLFKDMYVDEVIEGGQTMNPSVEDILNAIEKINSDNVVILPNNSNIILAAEKACELTSKKCVVIPTKEVAQGLSAALVFDPEIDIKGNEKEMKRAFRDMKCAQVTTAVRTTQLDGFDIQEGDIIGLDGKKIIAKSNSVRDTAMTLIDKLADEDSEIITLYYGEGVDKEQAEELKEIIQEKFEDCEVECYYGGQPHYHYFIAIE